MYTFLWLYLFLTALAAAGNWLLFTGDIVSVWGAIFRKLYLPATAVWFIFLRFHFVRHWSVRTAGPLREGEKNPEGAPLFLICLSGALFFGLATIGLLSGPAVIVNNFSAKSMLVNVAGTVSRKGSEKTESGERFYLVVTDGEGRDLRRDVDRKEYDSYQTGDPITAEFHRGPMGFYYR